MTSPARHGNAFCADFFPTWTIYTAFLDPACDTHLLTVLIPPRITLRTASPHTEQEDKMGKPKGLGAGRKLRDVRREQKWADKDYRKKNSGSIYKVCTN